MTADVQDDYQGEKGRLQVTLKIDEGPMVRVASDRKSTRLNSSHIQKSRMPSSA